MRMRNAHYPVVPAQAGAHSSARETLPGWHDFTSALLKILCLADPWVPAFTGTTTEQSDPWVPAFAGMESEMNEN